MPPLNPPKLRCITKCRKKTVNCCCEWLIEAIVELCPWLLVVLCSFGYGVLLVDRIWHRHLDPLRRQDLAKVYTVQHVEDAVNAVPERSQLDLRELLDCDLPLTFVESYKNLTGDALKEAQEKEKKEKAEALEAERERVLRREEEGLLTAGQPMAWGAPREPAAPHTVEMVVVSPLVHRPG